jgi:predicted adenine nucleotide alpha hydrolase (AANH) superfamily ATPase
MSKMLLHICCAPCGLPIIDYLIHDLKVGAEDLALYFYNPNLYPPGEYLKRLREVEKIAKIYNLTLIEGKYDSKDWLIYLKRNLVKEPECYFENEERCKECLAFRLNNLALKAKELGYNKIATTLSLNRYKDTEFVNDWSSKLADKMGLHYETFPLDKNQAYSKGLELTKKYGIYRQKYCGCEYSLLRKTAN